MRPRIIRMSLLTGTWYDQTDQEAKSFEAHLTASLRGDIETNRRRLAKIAVPFFQKAHHQQYGRKIAPEKIRIRLERPEPALVASSEVEVQLREISYCGKIHHAKRFHSTILRLRKPRRPTKARRRKARRARKIVRRESRKGRRSTR